MKRIARYGKAFAVLAAALGLFGAAWAAAGTAHAQPTPPAVYSGSVTINGQPAPPGTAIVASIGNTVCGSTVTTQVGQYTLQCSGGQVGQTVTFTVNGKPAGSAPFDNTRLNNLNLVVEEPTPTPTATATATATPTRTPTPRVAATGTGLASDGGSSAGGFVLAALGLAVIGLGAAGALTLRRAR